MTDTDSGDQTVKQHNGEKVTVVSQGDASVGTKEVEPVLPTKLEDRKQLAR